MPQPIALKGGVYHLNVRVPADIALKVKGTAVVLPIDGKAFAVKASDKVILSLRTKDGRVAKTRFALALAALVRHWQSVRAGPVRLTHKQIMAIAGVFYQRQVVTLESNPDLTPESLAAEQERFRRDVEGWRFYEEDGTGEIPLARAQFLAMLERPDGDALIAFREKADVETRIVSITYDEALERLFGRGMDGLCLYLGIQVEPSARPRLLREIGEAYRQAEAKWIRNLDGDYRPDEGAARFPAYEPPLAKTPTPHRGGAGVETLLALFERWKTHHANRRSASTLRRYAPSIASLDAWAEGRDWRLLTDVDVFAWATSRHEIDGVAPTTVNRNDLVAVSSVLTWPTTLSGGKLASSNAAAGIKLDLLKKQVQREKLFRLDEISAILKLARSVVESPQYPRASASRRWCPWLCAYSGARVQETLWLQTTDIRQEGRIWVMDFPRTKDGYARSVPIHRELIQEGFLDFVAAAPAGYLFVGDKPPKQRSTRTPQELRAAELAAWIRSKINLAPGVSPNHAWRHSWITYAEASGIQKRFSNRITGHNSGDASDRYVGQVISMLAAEMDKFPVYAID